MTRQIEIYRFDPGLDDEGQFREYAVPDRGGWSVMDALDFVQENIDPTLSYYRHSRCEHGICVRCALRVNGTAVLACEHPLPRTDPVQIAPVSQDHVLRDLIVRKRKARGAAPGESLRPASENLVSGLDHLMVFVRDLDRATALYRDSLGFQVDYGGRNDALGYHNGLIRFGLVYIELLAFTDRENGLESSMASPALRRVLAGRQALSLGYCARTEAPERLAARIKGPEISNVIGPLPMERSRPDGRALQWKLCLPGGASFQRLAWPFFVEWITPDSERLKMDPPALHPNGVEGIAGISIAVADLGRVQRIYEDRLALGPAEETTSLEFPARGVRYRLGDSFVDLLSPTGPGTLAEHLEAFGDGPFQIVLLSQSTEKFRQTVDRSQVHLGTTPDFPQSLLISDVDSFGLRLVVTSREKGGNTP